MYQSQLPNFIRKEIPKDEEAVNARLLIRGGFVDKLAAGVYSFLPLGLRVLKKIETVVREEMVALDASEVLLPVLHPKENWATTGRWQTLDVLFKVTGRDKKEYALGPTHEEIISPLAQRALFSYKDLPFALFQIQTKFRDEPRAKSGILRGREFLMKDLYSFHTDTKDLDAYYERAVKAYKKVFKRLGVHAVLAEASGGSFSKFSHEFQVFLDSGEDEIVYCKKCEFAQNREINTAKKGGPCPVCGAIVDVRSAAEVGNIFRLGTKYSEPFRLTYRDAKGEERPVIMGCYGIGISRLMGVLAELSHDERGLVWPAAVAPFDAHLIALPHTSATETKKAFARAKKLYTELTRAGVDVLFDDRNLSAGQKFAESDIMGIPVRLVISQKTGTKVEFKKRFESRTKLVDGGFVKKYFKKV
jgi:prolyl-tRNA synthetase